MRLAAQVAIVTGGANGIGRATALLFAREGAQVVVADRDGQAGEACVRAITAVGGSALWAETDVSSQASVTALVTTAVGRFGGLDVLVNCAGISLVGSVVDTEPERWERVLDVNLAGIYRTCRAAIPHMIRKGGGAIVNLASLEGLFGRPQHAAYAASKAAIIGLTRQIAVDYAQHAVRCKAISPGGITTQLAANTARLEPALASTPAQATARPSASQRHASHSRLFDFGRPEDVAYAALYLSSPEAAHVSGHNLVVDGGASCRAG